MSARPHNIPAQTLPLLGREREVQAIQRLLLREDVRLLTLEGRSQNIRCPLLVVFGAGDRLISPAEGERLAKTASGPAELVVYPEGNHVCFNISYKFRPLTADWMAKMLCA